MSVQAPSFLAVISNATDGTLYSYLIRDNSLSLYHHESIGEKAMPMALSPDNTSLFVHTRGEPPALIHCSLQQQPAYLRQDVPVHMADNLVHLTLSPDLRYLYGVSYATGELLAYDAAALRQGECRVLARVENIPHAHCAAVSPDGQFVYVTSLSSGRIVICQWQGETLRTQGSVLIAPDFGPRHLCLNKQGDRLYVVSEFTGALAVLQRDAQRGALTLEPVSSRPQPLVHLKDGFPRPNATAAIQPDPALLRALCWASEIQVTPDERFVYIAERTSSQILMYRRDAQEKWQCSAWTETEQQPRCIQLTPCGNYLLSCGEKSRTVSLYRRAALTGELTLLGQCAGGEGANCIVMMSVAN